MPTNSLEAKHGPLHDAHAELGAKFGDFGGWLMPLEFAGGGVVAEHTSVRERVGAFDVSHMGTFTVKGPGAKDALNEVLTNDLNRIEAGQAQYSLLCASSGGVLDDLLVYVRADDDVFVVPNASNTAIVIADVASILAHNAEIQIEDRSGDTAILAIQGPNSPKVLAGLGLPSGHDYMSFVDVETDLGPVVVARSGYTGEHGYELLVSWDLAPQWWSRIVAQCRAEGGTVCGLGARDTLRTEMGYPLHGHELGTLISPLEGGVAWAIGWDKPNFVGRGELVKQRATGVDRRLRGLKLLDRGVPRPEMIVRRLGEDTAIAGVLTSGTFSPTLKAGIALALMDTDVALGEVVCIDIRGRACQAEVVKAPFVDSDPRR